MLGQTEKQKAWRANVILSYIVGFKKSTDSSLVKLWDFNTSLKEEAILWEKFSLKNSFCPKFIDGSFPQFLFNCGIVMLRIYSSKDKIYIIGLPPGFKNHSEWKNIGFTNTKFDSFSWFCQID